MAFNFATERIASNKCQVTLTRNRSGVVRAGRGAKGLDSLCRVEKRDSSCLAISDELWKGFLLGLPYLTALVR